MSPWYGLVFVLLWSYLVGAVPTALWFGRLTRGIDIRQHGSGNAGATNALRVFGWKAGLLVLLVDMSKGFAACWWWWRLGPMFSADLGWDPVVWRLFAGCAAVTGHILSVFAGFRGGKGVGTAAGMFFALLPLHTGLCVALFGLVTWRLRWVSLGSLTAAAALPTLTWVGQVTAWHPVPTPLLAVTVAVAVIIFVSHRNNLQRLWQGREPQLGDQPTTPSSAG